MSGKKFKSVHMSLGAVTLEDEHMVEVFTEFYNIAGKQGALRSSDPNLRSNMISGEPCQYAKRVEKFLASVDLVKMSDVDLEFLYGKGVDMDSVAAKWLQHGP